MGAWRMFMHLRWLEIDSYWSNQTGSQLLSLAFLDRAYTPYYTCHQLSCAHWHQIVDLRQPIGWTDCQAAGPHHARHEIPTRGRLVRGVSCWLGDARYSIGPPCAWRCFQGAPQGARQSPWDWVCLQPWSGMLWSLGWTIPWSPYLILVSN